MLPCAMHVAGAMQVVHHLKNPISDDILRNGRGPPSLVKDDIFRKVRSPAYSRAFCACWYSNLPGYFTADLALKPWNAVIS